tara:strand:- start:1262 stop:1774 length:513 start_codon:yes stop_codon:yes gene_type:complete
MLFTIAKGAGIFAVICYVGDVLVRPTLVARTARKTADRQGLPLLNVGAGTAHSSLRSYLFGPTTWGDYNVDIAAADSCETPVPVCYGDAHALPFEDNTFGAVILSHCLEHVEDPQAVLAECRRVTVPQGKVYAITPPWFTPHAWTHPGHRWLMFGPTVGSKTALPLWNAS